MTNPFDSSPAGDLGTEDDDTIEIELNESQVRWLSQAAVAERPTATALQGASDRRAPDRSWEKVPETTALHQTAASHQADVPQQAAASHEAAVPHEAAVLHEAGVPHPTPAPKKAHLRLVLMVGSAVAAVALLSGMAYLAAARIRRPAPAPVPVVAPPVSAPTPPEMPASPPPPEGETVRFRNPFDRTEVFEFPPGTSTAEARAAVADLLAQRAHDRQDLLAKMPPRHKRTAEGNRSVTRLY
jgi:hypothetical protein